MRYLDEEELEMKARIEKYQNEINEAKELQKNYDFEIPLYLLEEMEHVSNNTFYFIWLAEKNNRISHENADRLREDLRKELKYTELLRE